MRFLLAISTGIFSVAWWPQLPNFAWYFGLIAALTVAVGCCCLLWRANKILLVAPCFGWGSLWGVWSGYKLLNHQLPAHMDTEVLSLTGTVTGLIHSDDRRSRFSLIVDAGQEDPQLRRLLLSWYAQGETVQKLQPGDHCQFTVRLRRPRGLLNRGVFDYQAWLLREGFSATGYVTEPVQHCTKSRTVLVAPHHGSKTSSTTNFVSRLQPQHVVFSAGYRHHFGHPHPQVVNRYQRQGSRLWHTPEQGALTFVWDQSGNLQIASAREHDWRFWWR